MQIVAINTYLEKLPLVQPYRIAYQNIEDTEIIYLEIILANGIIGYGAANPFAEVTGETPATTLSLLKSAVVENLIGKDISDFNTLIDFCAQHFATFPGALAAVDIALHDAYCKYYNMPVYALYGQARPPLPTSITIGIKPVNEMLIDALAYYEKGFRVLKLKTGTSVDDDISIVQKLHEQFGASVKIRVDANLGYTLTDLNKFIDATAHCALELIEQPLPVGDEHVLLTLPDTIRKKLVADESLTGYSSAEQLVKMPQPFGVFNIKLMKAGGIKAAKKIADLAKENNIQLFWGCNDESLISIAAALHIAYACSNTKYLDLDGSIEILENNFTGGFTIKNGLMYLADGNGLGVSKREK